MFVRNVTPNETTQQVTPLRITYLTLDILTCCTTVVLVLVRIRTHTEYLRLIDAIDGEFNAVRLQAYKGKKSILVATHYKLCRGERVGAASRVRHTFGFFRGSARKFPRKLPRKHGSFRGSFHRGNFRGS